jgi:leucyl-tRNA synthetase
MVKVRPDPFRPCLSETDGMATERYNPRASEPKWQKAWDEAALFATDNSDPRPKYYVLEMFPYPSGRIHMGHVRNYAMGDVVARYKRAKGFNVLHPMGWDAFGLPAENAARDNKVNPRDWTYSNIATMKGQLKTMGLSLDWAREFATCDPSYYRHQQKLFLDFWKGGLVERRNAKVNWDPVDMTVLANEQVIDGKGWRSGAEVEQRDLTQWFFKITSMSQDLLDGLDTLDRWPEKVRLMQSNWIGRSEGLSIRWKLVADTAPAGESELEVYTTRPTRCSAPPSWRSPPIIRWPGRPPRTIRNWPPSWPRSGAPARRPPRSRRPRRRVSTPASASSIPSTRAGRCRSMSPISC